jgi:hypothetical protein
MNLSNDASDEINFWPAYVDALINVVLNLLFLVGVFTIGLVSLNEQALFAEKEANKRKLASLESARSLQERRQMAEEILRSLPPAPTVVKVDQPQIHEIYFKSESRIKAAVEVEPLKQSQSASTITFEQFKNEMSKDGDLSRITFEPNQYSQPSDWAWLEQVKARGTGQKSWFLYVIADPTNQRLSREAYARLVFVRSALLQAGASPEQIQMKVTPAAEVSSLPLGIERTVWVIERSR